MDSKLEEKIEQKIQEALSNTEEIKKILQSLENLSSRDKSFVFGIVIGRLYNSFCYQCRRILKRDPTPKEFSDFILLLKKHESEILEKLSE